MTVVSLSHLGSGFSCGLGLGGHGPLELDWKPHVLAAIVVTQREVCGCVLRGNNEPG